MNRPFIQRSRGNSGGERGVTMIIVALAMVAIIALAALSIDVITLYLAREEAQRSADSAALAAAKIISVSGLTGDPTNSTGNWGKICGPDDGINGLATRTAKAVAGQDAVGGLVATTINVTYSAEDSGTSGDCTTLTSSAFGINPMVTVQLQRASLPSFFSRIWGNTGNSVSAKASAETYNPSNSGSVTGGTVIPVQPRCVKPWVVPNRDPMNPLPVGGVYCDQGTTPILCHPIVSVADGSITHPGISTATQPNNGIIGETFWLDADCRATPNTFCNMRHTPEANYSGGSAKLPPNLLYVPGQVGTPVLAVSSSCGGDDFQNAIVGCDQPTNYSCGLPPASAPDPNAVDMTIYPRVSTSNGGQCLIHQGDPTDVTSASGQDYLSGATFGVPGSYPFQMLAGSNNPTGLSGSPVSMSASIVSLPIYDDGTATVNTNTRTPVTFVGFLQVFINAVDQFGNINVTVLNVAGCSGPSVSSTAQVGNSPVPVRLITPP
ncbi:MAG TPA: pilus assembly protein TadG-related protein [Candidatus Sulfotelmatobacter sp.]